MPPICFVADGAKFCAGSISRSSAWKLAYHRGILAAQLAKQSQIQCAMMAVNLSAANAEQSLNQIGLYDQLIVAVSIVSRV